MDGLSVRLDEQHRHRRDRFVNHHRNSDHGAGRIEQREVSIQENRPDTDPSAIQVEAAQQQRLIRVDVRDCLVAHPHRHRARRRQFPESARLQ